MQSSLKSHPMRVTLYSPEMCLIWDKQPSCRSLQANNDSINCLLTLFIIIGQILFQDLNIKEKVRVQVELCKVNGETSEPQVGYLTVKGSDCLGS